MTRSRDHFREFDDHTLLKHAFLGAYLQMRAFKLLQRPEAEDRVVFVDGFAGPGRDKAGNPGSPTIACTIAQKVRASPVSGGKLAAARVVVVAVETDPSYYQALVEQLEPFRNLEHDYVHTFEGTISDHIDAIQALTSSLPTLYFLDPFGVSGLDAASYPRMLSGPHNEIFALFSDVGAARLRGVVHAKDDDLRKQLHGLQQRPSLFQEMDRNDEHEIHAAAQRRQAARGYTEPAAREAITRALGDDSWIKDLKQMSSSRAQEELLNRFVQRLRDSGAQFVQVIPTRDAAGQHKYCLIHASKSRKAWTTMKTAVSDGLRRDDLSQIMRDRIRDDLAPPVEAIVAWLQERLAGQERRWTGKKGEDAGTVKRSLLDETIVFDFQCQEVKDALKARGWLARRSRAEVCTIPAKSAHA